MTAFDVDLDELASVVERLDACAVLLAERLAELDDAVAAGRAQWTGEAADAQGRAHAQIRAGAEEMHGALIRLHAAARQAHESYTAAVSANAATWRFAAGR